MSCPAILMMATRPWSGRWVSAKPTARRRISRSRWPNGRWWRWPAATGARPRSGPGRQAACCAGPGSRTAAPCPWYARCKPAQPSTGAIPRARQQLVSAQRQRLLLTYALPHLAGQARIELIRVHLALADLAGARTLIAEVDELLRRRPGLGTLPGQAEELRAQLSKLRGPEAPGASALTAAELRLLPMLATHLSFPQIAEQMSLSRHTVKAQATSIYRKLGASSRNQAVIRARDLGLLDG